MRIDGLPETTNVFAVLRKRMKRVFAPLLVLALLACHGAYTAAEHQSLFELVGATQLHTIPAELPAGDGAEPHGWDVGATSYAAVLVVVAAVVWPRLGRVLLRLGGLPTGRPVALRALPVLIPPRPPTAPSLQVYRL